MVKLCTGSAAKHFTDEQIGRLSCATDRHADASQRPNNACKCSAMHSNFRRLNCACKGQGQTPPRTEGCTANREVGKRREARVNDVHFGISGVADARILASQRFRAEQALAVHVRDVVHLWTCACEFELRAWGKVTRSSQHQTAREREMEDL